MKFLCIVHITVHTDLSLGLSDVCLPRALVCHNQDLCLLHMIRNIPKILLFPDIGRNNKITPICFQP